MNDKQAKQQNFLGVERIEGERSEPDRSGTPKKFSQNSPETQKQANAYNPEVAAPRQRKFRTVDEKLAILKEIDHAPKGQIGGILRRIGIYWSQVSAWKVKFAEYGRDGLSGAAQKKARKASSALEKENNKLKSENSRLETKLKQAQIIIDVQKKIAQILENDGPNGSRN